jgi:hypothetical protein
VEEMKIDFKKTKANVKLQTLQKEKVSVKYHILLVDNTLDGFVIKLHTTIV